MAVFKCKMCGGELDINEGVSVVECEYCGTKQTVPNPDNEKKVNLFNRANRLRMASEFDKAAGIYESIIAEFPEEAEAYWGLCLCNYGIEYVDDPATAKKIPTCHRASFESLQKDESFELALEYADVVAQKVYRDEAREIDRIMQEILAVSKNEKPYDVFICYKETDEKGERTVDSVLAYDIYETLTAKGYNVFFSRVTLEDKLGMQYEPYIFAALNSAKVMLSIGTKYEYFHAVWVKNEWSRFLKLMAKDKSKVLIPCFKDIDAYDMPEEFKALQAQDLGKLGAVQDIVRGVEKIISKNESAQVKETVVVSQSGGPNVEALLKRGNNALEDGNFSEAKTHFDKVLDIDAECAEAYLGLAMTENKVSNEKDFVFSGKLDNKNYIRAKQYADKALLDKLTAFEKAAEEERLKKEKVSDEKAIMLEPLREKISQVRHLIAAGYYHTVGLKSDGTVEAAGWNFNGQCNVFVWENVVAVAVGNSHTVGLKSDGTVVAVGENEDQQCNVSGWKNIVAVAAGCDHTVGLKTDGTVVAVGSNSDRQCNVSGWKNIVAVTTGNFHTVGLKSDGTVVAVGNNEAQQCNVSGWKNIVAVTTGSFHTVGLKSDGTVVAVGENEAQQCNVSGWKNIVAIAAGGFNTVGLKSDGTVVAVGENEAQQCNVSGWKNIVAVAVGDIHTVGLKADGTVVSVGHNSFGQCNVSEWKLFDDMNNLEKERICNQKAAEEARIKLVDIRKKNSKVTNLVAAASSNYIVGLKTDGTVVTTGYAPDGRSNVSEWENIVAVAAGNSHTIGLKSDGTAVAVGWNFDKQCNVSEWKNIVAVAGGDSHTVGLKSDGTVVAAGSNSYRQCNVSEWKNIVAVAGGDSHTVGLKSDGTVVAVGENEEQQCNVSEWENIVAVAAGKKYTVGLKSNGTVFASGWNFKDQCEVSEWKNIVAIAAGKYHTVGLKSDGTVVAVGENKDQQCNVSEWENIVAIATGAKHTVGLKSDGTVVAAGDIDYCKISKWKLFADMNNLEEERKQKIAERAAELKQIAEKERREYQQAIYRIKGVCQHCGGEFKGLFTKKCSNCGKAKDY